MTYEYEGHNLRTDWNDELTPISNRMQLVREGVVSAAFGSLLVVIAGRTDSHIRQWRFSDNLSNQILNSPVPIVPENVRQTIIYGAFRFLCVRGIKAAI